MDVYIGPYKNWWGPYQIFALAQKLGVKGETTDYWAEHCPEWFTDLCNWVYSKRKRKIKIKLYEWDTWNLDSTMALIMIPCLEQLKETKHGIPSSMFESTEVDQNGNPTELSMALAKETWNEVLDHMIWSLKQCLDEEYEAFQIVKGEIDIKDYPEDEGKACVPLRWGVEPQTNWDAYFAYHEQIQVGLNYIGKYWRNLWS